MIFKLEIGYVMTTDDKGFDCNNTAVLSRDEIDLTNALKRILNAGFILTDADTAFIASATGLDRVEEIAEAMADPESPDIDLIRDFILFPDEQARMKMEPILASIQPGREQENRVTRALSGQISSVRVRWEGGRENIPMIMTGEAVRTFVARFYVTRTPDLKVAAALEKRLGVTASLKARTAMRCRKGRVSSEAVKTLIHFCSSDLAHGANVTDRFLFLYDILVDMRETDDPETCLVRRREELKRTHRQIREVQSLMDSHGMEYLLMNRITVPPESLETVTNDRLMLEGIMADLGLSFPGPEITPVFVYGPCIE